MLATVFAGAFAMQMYVEAVLPPRSAGRALTEDYRAFDTGSDRIWDNINRGVRTMEELAMRDGS